MCVLTFHIICVSGTNYFRLDPCDADTCCVYDEFQFHCWCDFKVTQLKLFNNRWVRLLETGVGTLETVFLFNKKFGQMFGGTLFKHPGFIPGAGCWPRVGPNAMAESWLSTRRLDRQRIVHEICTKGESDFTCSFGIIIFR